MKKITLPVLALVFLTVPQLLDAQQRGRGGRGGFLQRQNPIEAFLQRADSLELDLTGDQTSRLEVLREELDETTAQAQDALAALIEQASGGFDQGLREQIRPHFQAIQEGNEAALQTVRVEVLTEEQWTAVRAYLDAIQPQGRRGGRRGGGPG